jgi:hypothetical protein
MSISSHCAVTSARWKAPQSSRFCISVDRMIVRSIDTHILALNRCIYVCAEMNRHCKHSSMAKTCAIFAYLILACSECHDLFNHETSQSMYVTCLSAAGDKAISEAADLQLPPEAVNVGWLDTARGTAISASMIFSSSIVYGRDFPGKSP